MRLHTDRITRADLALAITAARAKGVPEVAIADLTDHRSRTRGRAYELRLSGTSIAGGAYGTADYTTATWDEWGVVLGVLYKIDPDMIVGSPGRPIYSNGEHFRWATGYRFSGLSDQRPLEACRRHRWKYDHHLTGAYTVHDCSKCYATRRSLLGDTTWEDVA